MFARRETDLHGRIVADLGALPPVDHHAVGVFAILGQAQAADHEYGHAQRLRHVL